tara:strand:+ start:3904 stop:4914 length:1011 start_codon:yes stop_codon:yes gene_type:complete
LGSFLIMQINEKYKVLIVGCGNIGGRFDFDFYDNFLPQTHAGAYLNHKGFEISACIDPDTKRGSELAKKFKIPNFYNDFESIFATYNSFDVISICSPTKDHFESIKQSLKLRPRLIFCEKPISYSLEDAKAIKSICESANVPVLVNLSRRFDSRIIDLKEKISNNLLGELRTVIGIYNKGILNNGIHMIDLIKYLFTEIKIINVGNPIKDFLDIDPTISILMETKDKVPIYIGTSRAFDYSLFELQLVFSEIAISIEDGGQMWRERKVIESSKFRDYKCLNKGEFSRGGDSMSMINAIENIYGYLSIGEKLKCTIDDAISAQIFCEEVKIKSIYKS